MFHNIIFAIVDSEIHKWANNLATSLQSISFSKIILLKTRAKAVKNILEKFSEYQILFDVINTWCTIYPYSFKSDQLWKFCNISIITVNMSHVLIINEFKNAFTLLQRFNWFNWFLILFEIFLITFQEFFYFRALRSFLFGYTWISCRSMKRRILSLPNKFYR